MLSSDFNIYENHARSIRTIITRAMLLEQLNVLPEIEAHAELLKCCGATRWVMQMLAKRPFSDTETLQQLADEIWAGMIESDWLEAFAAHPRIGGSQLPEVAKDTALWTSKEQSGMQSAEECLKTKMAEKNAGYEQRFGFIYIVCASGKSAPELLDMLTRRLYSDRDTELRTAAGEQLKITHLRLDKLLNE